MISFNLSCEHGHAFEGWFSSSADFDDQQARGLVSCPICDSAHVNKALMTPNVAAKSNQRAISAQALPPLPDAMPSPPSSVKAGPSNDVKTDEMTASMTPKVTPEMQEKLGEALAEMRKFQKTVEANCDDVGSGFATEARKMHYGEVEPRGIYGHTSESEAESLVDEGIDITRMPWLPKEN